MSQSPLSGQGEVAASYEDGWAQIIDLIRQGGSWSGRERNCCFLNRGDGLFTDISAVAGLDFIDDGRAIATVDWDQDGDLDLWMTNRTGPRVRFVRNEASADNHFLSIRLIGTRCNRDAIGARVEVHRSDQRLVKSLRTADGYLGQSSKWIHFGLGAEAACDRVVVHWPAGEAEVFEGIAADARWTLTQGTGQAVRDIPSPRTLALQPSTLPVTSGDANARIVLLNRVPLPQLDMIAWDRDVKEPVLELAQPTLINLWAGWCVPCLGELSSFAQQRIQFQKSGLQIVAVNVEKLPGQPKVEAGRSKQILNEIDFPFRAGWADESLLGLLTSLQEATVLKGYQGQVPASFLVDARGRLAAIYHGPVTPAQVLVDAQLLDAPRPEQEAAAFPFSGRWFARPFNTSGVLVEIAADLLRQDQYAVAQQFARLASEFTSRDRISETLKLVLADVFYQLGVRHFGEQQWALAAESFLDATRLRGDWAEAHTNLAAAYQQMGDLPNAAKHLEIALHYDSRLSQARFNYGAIQLVLGNHEEARLQFDRFLQLHPEPVAARMTLATLYVGQGMRREARAQYEAILTQDPAHREAHRALQALQAGRRP